MKRLAYLGALAALTLSPSVALADDASLDLPDHGPVAPDHDTITEAAHELTRASGQLAHLLAAAGRREGLSDHAMALHEAAARFAEALAEADIEALQDRFAAIEHSFNALRDAIRTVGTEETPEVHGAWSRIREIHGRLTVAWYARWARVHLPPRGED